MPYTYECGMKKSAKNKIKLDVIVITLILAAAVVSLVLISVLREDGEVAVVTVDGDEVGRYSLSENVETEIVTENGKNVLCIKDGQADVTFADCPDGICSAHRPIDKSGETIVCLPHKLVISIVGGEAG